MAKTNESPDLHSEIEALKADLGKIRQDLHSLGETAAHVGRDGAKFARDKVSENVEACMGQVQDYMQKQPITTVLIAFGAGMIASKIFGRGR